VPHWKEHFAGQTDFGEIGRTLEFVVGALTSKSIENLTWNRPYRGILRPGLPSCQPEGLKLNLFEYQLQGLAWMLNIEHTCKLQKYSFSTILKAPGSLSFGLDARGIAESDSFDASQIILNPDAHITDTKYQESFTSSGGMMADEMGLGKTISMIALILSNPRKTNSNGEFSSLGGEYVVYESKATLILCPSQLITQWEREITTHTSLAVHTVLTIRDQKAQSYQQLLDADVVIVPHNLILDNKKYRDYANSKKSRAPAGVLSKGAVFQQIGWHRIIIDEGHEALSEPLKNNPNAYMNKGYGEWEDFSANYRWYVTGTPVPRGRASLIGALDFIQLKVASGFELQPVVQLLNTPFEYLIFHAAKRCLFWRNTKASVTSQTNIPPLTEKVELIQLSPIEQALYDAANVIGNPKILRAVCSNPLETEVIPASIISEVKTLNDPNLPKMVVEHFREQIERIQEGLPGMKTLITTTREKYELAVVTLEAFGPKPLPAPEGSARAVIEEANARIAQYRALVRDVAKKEGKMKRAADSLTRAENNIIKYVQQSACFSRLLGSPDSDSCDLCDKYLHDPVSLECSHCFCWACIIAHVRKHQACPSCNTTVFLEHIPKPLLKDSPASKKKKSKTQDWFQQTVGTHGTKLASIAKHLRGVMAGDEIVKIIVFSQYDHILETLSNLLAQADPANFADKIISCKGNVHIRKKLIARFNSLDEDSPRILLLSLAHSASGTHLAVATHVILVDPVVGARDEAQATDAQAIARAHRLGQDRPVVAVRFIVERTIDQLDYEHAYGCVPTK
jgi:SNF2 family DNA or RNA helicase